MFLSILIFLASFSEFVNADIDYNTINDDGTYRFRHSNDDIGGYYHSATAGPDSVVRGRYGSRNPATGQIEETVYTAGPRGYRVRGPKVHRKMNLAQYPVGPRGSLDDPLADPYDDPSYSFGFRAADQSRSEESDATGRVRGLYSFIDDVGERHTVRYAAGAGTGFEVTNAVPDNPINVEYTSPLYKAHPKTRGKMSVQRGPAGSYKLILAGPDHRRAETRGPDGLVRGTYSYLDDKGIQRTVEYIAGAGIGYRVLQNTVGSGTHINPTVTDFRLSDSDFKLSNDYGGSSSKGKGKGSEAGKNSNRASDKDDPGDSGIEEHENSGDETTSTDNVSRTNGSGSNNRRKGNDRRRPSSGDSRPRKPYVSPKNSNRRTNSGDSSDSGGGYNYDAPSDSNFNMNIDDVGPLPPLVTVNRKILEYNRDREWVNKHRDSTIIKNVGNWYITLPPGQSVRAHVQNIDLLPLGGRRVPSPSEALRQDEIADMVASLDRGRLPYDRKR